MPCEEVLEVLLNCCEVEWVIKSVPARWFRRHVCLINLTLIIVISLRLAMLLNPEANATEETPSSMASVKNGWWLWLSCDFLDGIRVQNDITFPRYQYGLDFSSNNARWQNKISIPVVTDGQTWARRQLPCVAKGPCVAKVPLWILRCILSFFRHAELKLHCSTE